MLLRETNDIQSIRIYREYMEIKLSIFLGSYLNVSRYAFRTGIAWLFIFILVRLKRASAFFKLLK